MAAERDRFSKIRDAFQGQEVQTKLMDLMYKRASVTSREEAVVHVQNFLDSFLRIVKSHEGNKQNIQVDGKWEKHTVRLIDCTIPSLVSCAFESLTMGIPVDERDLAYLIPVAKEREGKAIAEAKFEISYKGYVYKVQDLYDNADIRTIIVWPEDEYRDAESAGRLDYFYKPANPFRSDYHNAIGCVCIIFYTINGEERHRIERIGMGEINQIRSKAKQDFIWAEWFGEKMKVATIRRACKLPSIRNEEAAKLDKYLNQDYHTLSLERPSGNGVQGLLKRIEQEKVVEQPKEEIPLYGQENSLSVDVVKDPNSYEMSGWDRKTVWITPEAFMTRKWQNPLKAAEFLYSKFIITPEKEIKEALIKANEPLMDALKAEGFSSYYEKLILTVNGGNYDDDKVSDEVTGEAGKIHKEGDDTSGQARNENNQDRSAHGGAGDDAGGGRKYQESIRTDDGGSSGRRNKKDEK